MKRFAAFVLAILISLSVLNISKNGKGTIEFKGNSYDARFSAQNGAFSAASEGDVMYFVNHKGERYALTRMG